MKTKQTPIDADSLKPEVWTMDGSDGSKTPFLVCRRSFFRPPIPPKDQRNDEENKLTLDYITFPVAVMLARPSAIFYGLIDNSHTWHAQETASHGISMSAARAALAEAYRGIEKIAPASFPKMQWKMHAKTRWITNLTDCSGEHEESMFRAVNLCVHWDGVKKHHATLAEQWRAMADFLAGMGIPTGWRQVKKITEKHGL